MDRPTCGTCLYFKRHAAEREAGECRRFPPTVALAPEQSEYSNEWRTADFWPSCRGNDWCGEHPDFPAYIANLKGEARDKKEIEKAYAEYDAMASPSP